MTVTVVEAPFVRLGSVTASCDISKDDAITFTVSDTTSCWVSLMVDGDDNLPGVAISIDDVREVIKYLQEWVDQTERMMEAHHAR